MAEDDKRRLEKTIEALEMRFGARTVRRLGTEAQAPAERLATGFSALDDALGGGLPRGRITEMTGAPTTGMATLALKVVAQAQEQGQTAVYLDLPRTFDADYAARCGIALDRFLLVHPYDARQAFALLRDFAGSEHGVLVCDLPPTIAASQLTQSLSATLGRLLLPLSRSSTVLICLVSLPPAQKPSAHKLPLRHYATVRLLLRRERWLYRGADIRGYRAQVIVVKNKAVGGRPGQKVPIDITFNGSSSNCFQNGSSSNCFQNGVVRGDDAHGEGEGGA